MAHLVDGKWTPWAEWESCSVSCDSGTRRRTRDCTDPAPAFDGKVCFGNTVENQPCTLGQPYTSRPAICELSLSTKMKVAEEPLRTRIDQALKTIKSTK